MDENVEMLIRKYEQRLAGIENTLQQLLERETIKDWYTTAEVAERLEKAQFTVMEWCRMGRINAVKKGSGRGKHQSWVVSHDELGRYRREGLLPINPQRNVG